MFKRWQHHLANLRRVESNILLGKVCAATKYFVQICCTVVCQVLGKKSNLTNIYEDAREGHLSVWIRYNRYADEIQLYKSTTGQRRDGEEVLIQYLAALRRWMKYNRLRLNPCKIQKLFDSEDVPTTNLDGSAVCQKGQI